MSNNTTNPKTSDKYQAPDLPDEARLDPHLGLDACPWLDEYIEFSKKWSPRSYDGYHEAVGLWILSTIAARRVAITNFGKERYTNLYIILVGRTTLYAKSTVVQIAKELLQKIGLDFLLLPDESTPQRMIKDMSSELPDSYDKMNVEQKDRVKLSISFAGQRGWFFDEFGQNIHLMMQKDGPYSEFRGLFRKFDDTESKYERATISRGKETINKPYLALLGVLTPSDITLFARRGSILWGDGYLARMALVVPPEGLITEGRFPEGKRNFPESLMKPLRDWHARLGIPQITIQGGIITNITSPTVIELELSKEARDAYYRYDQALRKILLDIHFPDMDGNYGRFPEKALRIASLFASLENNPQIEIKHWARAQEIVERWRRNLHELYRQVNEHKKEKKEIAIVDKVKRAIIEKVFPTKREIEQFTGLSAEVVGKVLDKLKAEGKIIEEKVGKTYRYRRASQEKKDPS